MSSELFQHAGEIYMQAIIINTIQGVLILIRNVVRMYLCNGFHKTPCHSHRDSEDIGKAGEVVQSCKLFLELITQVHILVLVEHQCGFLLNSSCQREVFSVLILYLF